MFILFWLYMAFCGYALVQIFLMNLQVWENRRFVPKRLADDRGDTNGPKVALLSPCKGLDLELEDNLRCLFEQDYENYEILFIVEAADDPARPTINKLMQQYPAVPAKLIVAGRAENCGQKVHNLLAAVDATTDDVAYLAFVDSDARPRRGWLRLLVRRLDNPKVTATTGYRCLVPQHNTLPNLILTSINTYILSLYGSGGMNPIWGGSWAIRRDAFLKLIRPAWPGTLSDDVVAAAVLRKARHRVEYEPGCTVASACHYTASQAFEFMRRQDKMIRFYAPFWWWVGLAASTAGTFAFWGNLIGGIAGAAVGAAWAWMPLSVSAAMYAGYLFCNWQRQRIVSYTVPHLSRELRASRWFDLLCGPITGLANWIGLVCACFSRSVVWRGIHYRVARDGQVRIVARDGVPVTAAVPPEPPATAQRRAA